LAVRIRIQNSVNLSLGKEVKIYFWQNSDRISIPSTYTPIQDLVSLSRSQDPVLFYPLDPGSGSGMNFFRIPDPVGMFLVRFFKIIFLCTVGSWMKTFGIRNEQFRDPDPGSRIKHPRSTKLVQVQVQTLA
jgi:hypothetical protein